jgi:hypothetical protein
MDTSTDNLGDIFMNDTNRYTHYLVLFLCSMIIPAMNTSAVSIALSNNNVDLIFYIIDFGVFGWGIQRLKEKDEHPIGIILAVTAIEDLIINLLCNIKPITYIIQGVIIILFAVYISYKNRSIKG